MKPIVAIVGRPNVGKSTFFNRLIGQRKAIVEDLPGTTRDRLYGETEWNGRFFTVVDTAGLLFEEEDDSAPLAEIARRVREQAELAIAEADAIIFMVDAVEGLTTADAEVADVLRQTFKPVVLAANKADNQERALNAVEFYALNLGEHPYDIEGIAHRSGDVLDRVAELLPVVEEEEDETAVRVAIVGRPNVGKSSLLNALANRKRLAHVSKTPGRTQALHWYRVDDAFHVVDCPGYGYAKAAGKLRAGWQAMIEDYLLERQGLRMILVLVDGEVGPTALDVQMLDWLEDNDAPFAIVATKPADVDPLVRGKFDLGTTFHRIQGDVKSELSPRLSQEVSFAVGPEQYRQRAGGIANQDFGAFTLRGRAEWIYKPTQEVRFAVGLDHASQHWTGDYEGIRPQTEMRDVPASQAPRIPATHISKWVNSPAAYAELGLLVADRVTFIPSVRADYIDQLSALTLDPRLVVRGRVTDSTVLKAGVGRFTQHPQMWQALPESGNVNLKPGWALHLSTGVEQRLGDDARVSLEGFYKSLHDLPVATPAFTAPYFDNAGRGRVVGLEMEARLSPSTKSPVYGLVSYTLSRSERARKEEPLRLFDNDQTHIGSAAAVWRMGRGWQAGATFRATSANPKTPIVGAVYDARTDTYAPRYGAINSDRAALYHRLDLHLEKTWTFTAWKLMAYLDVQNVYNATNSEYAAYNYDYTKSKNTPTFPPFFPSLGLRGEL